MKKLLTLAIAAALPLAAIADPAINTKFGFCHIGYDQYNQMNEVFLNPSEENGADIVVRNDTADGVCAAEDVKVKPVLLSAFFPPVGSYTLPYKIVLTGAQTGFLCRMQVDGATYYTNKWRSVITVKGGPALTIDKILICRDGVKRGATSYPETASE